MSNYIQALKRLEREGQIEVAAPAREPVRRAERVAAERGDVPLKRPTADPASGAETTAIAGLLERLRMLPASPAGSRVLVFAPATPGRAAHAVVERLAVRAREQALPLRVGELVRNGTQALLADRAPSRATETAVDLDGPQAVAGLREWVEHGAARHLALIAAPAISASADTLLLAAVCDGLVLVAETGTTPREALNAAAARARAAGCTLLGVVLTGS